MWLFGAPAAGAADAEMRRGKKVCPVGHRAGTTRWACKYVFPQFRRISGVQNSNAKTIVTHHRNRGLQLRIEMHDPDPTGLQRTSQTDGRPSR